MPTNAESDGSLKLQSADGAGVATLLLEWLDAFKATVSETKHVFAAERRVAGTALQQLALLAVVSMALVTAAVGSLAAAIALALANLLGPTLAILVTAALLAVALFIAIQAMSRRWDRLRFASTREVIWGSEVASRDE